MHVELSFVTSFYHFLFVASTFPRTSPRPASSGREKCCYRRRRFADVGRGPFVSLFLSMILFVGNSCVNFGFGSVCDLRCEKECCVFFSFFWFPLLTRFSWPAECGHGIEHVIRVQVSLSFFFWGGCFFPFCVVLRSCVGPCLFVCCAFCFVFLRFLRFFFSFWFCGCRRVLLSACVCFSVRAC
jgi:hypothetical protein